jgi:hypothetical protein
MFLETVYKRLLSRGLLLAACAGIVGCEAHAGYVWVAGPPPPPPAEVVIVNPGPAYVWVPGYWNYSRGGYVWITGTWRRPPHRGSAWIQPRWERRERGWVYLRGYWRD